MIPTLFLVLVFATALISLTFINSTNATSTNNCRMQLHTQGCQKDSDCSDFNGNALICSTEGLSRTCRCPSDVDCAWAPFNTTAPLFGNCQRKPCVSGGHGYVTGAADGCAQPIGCVHTIVQKGVHVTALCHTCTTCIMQGRGRYDCSSLCPGDWKKKIPKETPKPEISKEKQGTGGSNNKDEKDQTGENANYGSRLLSGFISFIVIGLLAIELIV